MKYIKLVLMLCICMSCNNTTQNNKQYTTQDNKQHTPQKDSSVAVDSVMLNKDTTSKTVLTPTKITFPLTYFEKFKAQCKYVNKKKFDLQEDRKDWWFGSYNKVSTKDFYRLGLPQVMHHKPDLKEEYTGYAYYAFQENINGNIGLVIGSNPDGSFTLTCIIYNRQGKRIGQAHLAGSAGDMGFVSSITGMFKNDSTYQTEYEASSPDKSADAHYKLDFTFTKEGNIIAGDTTFLLKPPPKKNN